MGALYYLKQKLVDFANVIQTNSNRTDTVPSSKVVYDLSQDVSFRSITIENVNNISELNLIAGRILPNLVYVFGYIRNTSAVSASYVICKLKNVNLQSSANGIAVLQAQGADGDGTRFIGVANNGADIDLKNAGASLAANSPLRISGLLYVN